MSKLRLSVAIGNYDRVRPLMDGTIAIDGVDPIFMNLPPEEIFFRAFRGRISISANCRCRALRSRPRSATVPMWVFRLLFPAPSATTPSMCARDRIKSPEDLKGKRVGLPEFQLTACVWARIILQDAHGVKPSDIIMGEGRDRASRPAGKDQHQARPRHCIEEARDGTTISELLARGDIDGFIAPRPPQPRAGRAIRISAGCLLTRSRPAAIISSKPEFFRSCI